MIWAGPLSSAQCVGSSALRSPKWMKQCTLRSRRRWEQTSKTNAPAGHAESSSASLCWAKRRCQRRCSRCGRCGAGGKQCHPVFHGHDMSLCAVPCPCSASEPCPCQCLGPWNPSLVPSLQCGWCGAITETYAARAAAERARAMRRWGQRVAATLLQSCFSWERRSLLTACACSCQPGWDVVVAPVMPAEPSDFTDCQPKGT